MAASHLRNFISRKLQGKNARSEFDLFSRFGRFASAVIGYIILVTTCIAYISSMISQPIERVAALGLSAFLIIIALAGICFGWLATLGLSTLRNTLEYAGEKFVHSSLLMLQTILIKYAFDTLVNTQLLNQLNWLNSSIKSIETFLVMYLGGISIWFSAYAFQAINDALWERFAWRKRLLRKRPGGERDDFGGKP